MATTLNTRRKRDPVDNSGLGSYLLRLTAMLFAIMLLICLPMLFMLMAIAPAQFDILSLLAGPIGTLLKVLAVVIGVFLLWGIIAVVRAPKL